MSAVDLGAELQVPDLDVSSFVLEGAADAGDKPALIDGPSGRELSYADLKESVRACAAGLAARGFGKGDVLAVYMPNVPEYAVAFHGAASAGGMCTTANPLYTARELKHQLEDSGAKLLLTVPALLDVAREAAEGTAVEEVLLELPTAGGEAPDVSIDPNTDLAVLPYSSGTTGLPKGVMLTHRNLVANIGQTQGGMQLDPDDVLMGCLPFFHIYGMTVIMNLGLRTGTTIVTMPRFDLEQFLDLIEQHTVTRAFVVPPIALALAKHPAIDGRDLSSLNMIMSGAAPLGAELSEKVADRIGCKVLQGYGMTETSPVTHMVPMNAEPKPGSIGTPLVNTESRLVDPESGKDVDDGERGEMWIRGPQVMAGYLNNAQATADTVDPEGWLHTGDIGVRDADGSYAIVDRLKELIKYKGFQVAPAELEALLLTHSGVADAAVIGVPDEEAGELPKAFIVPAEGGVDHDELMAWIAEQVSPQKKIRLVEEITEIPKSPSGKILRRELKDR